uniref:Pilus assembly protein n=1 Tax=Macrostomum lignano TaxID=282301 RepID=A0A1I8FFC9_9PLAT
SVRRVAAAGYRSGALLLWDTNSGSSRSVLACPSRESGSTGFCQLGELYSSLQSMPVCSVLLNQLRLQRWPVRLSLAGIEVGRIRLPDAATRGLTFSPDGQPGPALGLELAALIPQRREFDLELPNSNGVTNRRQLSSTMRTRLGR